MKIEIKEGHFLAEDAWRDLWSRDDDEDDDDEDDSDEDGGVNTPVTAGPSSSVASQSQTLWKLDNGKYKLYRKACDRHITCRPPTHLADLGSYGIAATWRRINKC